MEHLARLVLDRPLAFLDTETTGVEPAESRIVELALEIHFPGGTEPLKKVRRFNPGVPIPAEASEIHGITDEMVAHEPSFRQYANGIASAIAGADLAGFGIRRFDLPLLVAEFKRAGVAFDPKFCPEGEPRRIIDLLCLFHLEEPRDLTAAVRRYVGGDHEGAHSAMADVAVLPDVLAGMISTHAGLVALDLNGLHARCDEMQPYRTEVERWFGDDLSAPVFQFGKLKGQKLGADRGYVAWMLKQPTIDQDVKEFVEAFLARKTAA